MCEIFPNLTWPSTLMRTEWATETKSLTELKQTLVSLQPCPAQVNTLPAKTTQTHWKTSAPGFDLKQNMSKAYDQPEPENLKLKQDWNQSEPGSRPEAEIKSGLNPCIAGGGDPPPTLWCSSGSGFLLLRSPFSVWSRLKLLALWKEGPTFFSFFSFFPFEGGVHSCLP